MELTMPMVILALGGGFLFLCFIGVAVLIYASLRRNPHLPGHAPAPAPVLPVAHAPAPAAAGGHGAAGAGA